MRKNTTGGGITGRQSLGGRKFHIERLRAYYGWIQILVNIATFVIVSAMPTWQILVAGILVTTGTILVSVFDTKRVYEDEIIAAWKPALRYTLPIIRKLIREEIKRTGHSHGGGKKRTERKN